MFIRKYWIPLLVFSIAIVGVGLYLLAMQPAPEPIVIIKPAEPLEKTTAEKSEVEKSEVETEVPNDTSQGGHFHADGTWHEGPHEVHETPAAESSSTDVGTQTQGKPLTYHAELLESNPVEALRLQAEERGHWSAQWIPPFPPDDHEAAALARYSYLTVYYRSTGEIDMPKTAQFREEHYSLIMSLEGSGARHSDLLKLTWATLQAGDIEDPYYAPSTFPLPGMTYIASLGVYQYIPEEYVHLFKE